MADIEEKDCQIDQENGENGEKKAKKKHRKVRHHKKEEDGKEGKVRRKKKIKKGKSEVTVDLPDEPAQPPKEQQQRRRSSTTPGMSVEVQKLSEGKKISHFQAMAMLRKALVASLMTKKSTVHGNGKGNGNGKKKTASTEESAEEATVKENKENKERKLSESQIQIDVSSIPPPDNTDDTSDEEASPEAKGIKKIIQAPSKWKIVESEFIEGKDVGRDCQWRALLMHDLFPKTNVTAEDIEEEEESETDDDEEEEEEEGVEDAK